MSQDQTPDDFDWVVAQSKCSAASMFARLQTGVKEDVRRRNSLGRLGRDDGWTFEFHVDGEEFEVSRVEASGVTESIDSTLALVRFERAGRRIHVHGDGVTSNSPRSSHSTWPGCVGSWWARRCTRSGRSEEWLSSSCSSKRKRFQTEVTTPNFQSPIPKELLVTFALGVGSWSLGVDSFYCQAE